VTEQQSTAIAWRGRVRLVDEVADVIRERIYAGVYAPDVPLRQEQLAADLNISRTPLREALKMLETEGLVKSEPGRGVRVVSVDAPTLLAGYELREVLDGLAARLSARHARQADLDTLEAHIDTQRGALEQSDVGAYTRANVAFHAAIVEIAGNEFLAGQLSLIPLTAQVFTPARRIEMLRARTSVAEHERIVAAIAAGAEGDAEQAARAHIQVTIGQLKRSIADASR
jgi:DNA-binding GntR family transcriptional regulator